MDLVRMKDLKELLEACGTDGSYDQPFKPLDIVLKVLPMHIDLTEGGLVVEFRVLIPDKLDSPQPGQLRQIEYDVEFHLPVEAIELATETSI